jgi:exopolyphosphatase/guanosine-5'-triphosphate,3'-diphosphate pyrophosphatase
VAAGGRPAGCVTREGLDWLLERLLEAQQADRLRLPGMKEDRRPIIGGGVAILRAIFDLLQIDRMDAAAGGLRHGLLCDLAGSGEDGRDVRSTSVQRLSTKFNADPVHGKRVGRVALALFRQLAEAGPADADTERDLRKLHWAAELHEIGSHISHSDYHKHGAYILDNADAIGLCTCTELHDLSLLVLGHRGKLRKLEARLRRHRASCSSCWRCGWPIILCHARREPDITGMQLRLAAQDARRFQLSCRPGWAQSFPQSAHLLREEVLAWQKTPWSLSLQGA